MQITLDGWTIVEIIAIVGSAILGLLVLANHWSDRPGRLFGLLCLSLAVWKAFEFAYPGLSETFWVDAMGWAAGTFSVALAFHFVVAYIFKDSREPRWSYGLVYVFAALFILAASLGWLSNNTLWQVLYGAFFAATVAGLLVLIARAYRREGWRQLIWALLGAMSLGVGVGIQLIAIIWGLEEFYSQTLGMLGFEAFFAYDILVAGFLRERDRHLRALAELGLRERKLHEAEVGLRKLMDSSFDIIFTVDREGNLLAINTEAEEVLGFPVREMLGKGYLRFLKPPEREKVADVLTRGMQGEKIRFYEIVLNRPDGKPVILSITGTRLFEGEISALVIARDITKERRLERDLQERNLLLEEANRRLRELDTLKTELVGIVGHELRSPLTVIYSYSTALKDHWERMKEERKLECVDHVLRECNRLNRMVENILDMSRIESERMFLHQQPGDLVALLGDVTREMAMTPGARPVRLNSSAGSLEMVADWDKIKQVMINLLDNAFRFSPEDGRITVSADEGDGKVVVRVADEGPGVPGEDRERLFERFTQRKAEGMERGLGLGLYIVRTFIEAHGGEVWVEDPGGRGAVFAFSLPIDGGRSHELDLARDR